MPRRTAALKIGVDKLFIVVSFSYGFIAIYTFPYGAPERTAPPYAARPGDFASTARYLSDMKTAPQMLGHGEAFSAAGVPCARVPARVLRKSVRAASSHAAPTQPRSVTVACTSVKPPTAAPSEKPRYMKDALSERTIGASFKPTIWIKPVCCAGKKPQGHNPHAIIASKTGGSAIV